MSSPDSQSQSRSRSPKRPHTNQVGRRRKVTENMLVQTNFSPPQSIMQRSNQIDTMKQSSQLRYPSRSKNSSEFVFSNPPQEMIVMTEQKFHIQAEEATHSHLSPSTANFQSKTTFKADEQALVAKNAFRDSDASLASTDERQIKTMK